jgi:hypothetical protein
LHGYSLSAQYEKRWFFKYYNITHPNLKIICLTARHRWEPTGNTYYNSWFQYKFLRNTTAEKIHVFDLINQHKKHEAIEYIQEEIS